LLKTELDELREQIKELELSVTQKEQQAVDTQSESISLLTQLLEKVKLVETENDRLKKELRKATEHLVEVLPLSDRKKSRSATDLNNIDSLYSSP
jgi:cell shape-determining protein MreC